MNKIFAVSMSALMLALAASAVHAQAAGEVVWDGRDVYMVRAAANAEKPLVDECKTGPKAPESVVVTIAPKDSSEPITLKLNYAGCTLETMRDAYPTDPLLVVRKYDSGKIALILTGSEGQDKSSVFLSLGDGRFMYANRQAGEATIENAKVVAGRTSDLGNVVVISGYHQECKGLWMGEAKASIRAE